MDATFYLTKLTESQAQQICSWVYPSPYDLYAWMSWDEMVRDQRELADSAIREEQYRGLVHEQYGLSGFVQLFRMDTVIRLGLGLRPDMCGRGFGKILVQLAVQEAHTYDAHMPIDLEVHQWNERAIRVYEQVGFVSSDRYSKPTMQGIALFNCMVYQG